LGLILTWGEGFNQLPIRIGQDWSQKDRKGVIFGVENFTEIFLEPGKKHLHPREDSYANVSFLDSIIQKILEVEGF